MSSAIKRSNIIALYICFVLLGSFLIFLITCVSFRQTLGVGGAGECISIAFFEKQKMRSVDKVVLRVDDKIVNITDAELVGKIVKDTTVATRTGIQFVGEGYIDLYNGDKLVRSMLWRISTKEVKVYKEDATHWLIVSFDGEGFVCLSDELADKLNALLEEA